MIELNCVNIVNRHRDKLNLEGKKQLMSDIAEELSEAELNEFLKGYGYDD